MALKNLFGSLGLDETLRTIAIYLGKCVENLSRFYPDTSGRMRVNIEAGTLPTVTTVGTVTTVTTVTTATTVGTLNNVAAVGGTNAQYDQYGQMMVGAAMLRNQIKVTP